MSKPKSVKVRIAVAVDSKGRWSGFGWTGANIDRLIVDALNNDDLGMVRHAVIVEAAVPLPPPPKTLPAKVTKVKRSARK